MDYFHDTFTMFYCNTEIISEMAIIKFLQALKIDGDIKIKLLL